MELRMLEYFLAVADAGSMSAASERTYISRQALSKAISDLENELGVSLFVRSNNGINLTAEGNHLYKKANSILKQISELHDYMHSIGQTAVERLDLAFSMGTQNILWDPILRVKDELGFRLRISDHDDETCERLLRAGQADLITIAAPIEDSRYVSKMFYKSPLSVTMSKEHPLADRAKLSLYDIKDEQFLMIPDSFYTVRKFKNAARNRGYDLNIYAVSSNFFLLFDTASKEMEICPISPILERFATVAGAVCIPLEDDELSWELYAAWEKDRTSDPGIRFLLDHVFGIE